MAPPRFQRPTGTRDLFPEDLLRQRYITQAWRDVSIRHGFEEIAGPTFETLDLYTVKSGEGIVSELFSFTRDGGETPYALRPEFTPTLARMYAAHGSGLPKPVRWFTSGPYFRAERPQRGRLREFLQWNCDVIGGADTPSPSSQESEFGSDLDLLSVLSAALVTLGVRSDTARVVLGDRQISKGFARVANISEEKYQTLIWARDNWEKLPRKVFEERFNSMGITNEEAGNFFQYLAGVNKAITASANERVAISSTGAPIERVDRLSRLRLGLDAQGFHGFHNVDVGVVRGLAYYTGMVFEVIAEGERAVAGGGRYDNLIELFGGQPTPAVGFGMGDVVLSNLLEDHGLMPTGAELADAVSRAPASARPDAFVIGPDEGAAQHLRPLLALLRRGVESEAFIERAENAKPWHADRYRVPPLHARASDKSTKNLKKLLADAERQRARFAVIIHEPGKVQLKDMDTREDLAHDSMGDFSIDPQAPNFVGLAICARLGYLAPSHQAMPV